MTNENKLRVLLLVGNKLWNWNTVAAFKKSKLNISGICLYRDTILGLPINYILKSIKKRGFFSVIDQILGRLFYKMLNLSSDKKRLSKIFNFDECNQIFKGINTPLHFTNSYNNKKTLEWISTLNPDVVVVHSNGWVGKELRKLCKTGLVIGGHPGITPSYRGAYSSFWAIYNKDEENIGYSIFFIDDGVDTGDLIFQEKVKFSKEDSYMSIDWRCMKEIAKKQVEILEEYEKTKNISKTKHSNIPDKSEYTIPGLSHYLRYLSLLKNKKFSN